MLRRAIFAADMNMLADTIGQWCADMAMGMRGLALAWRLAFPTQVLIFLLALGMDMYGWAGLGFSAADIAEAMATGRLHGLTMSAASGVDLTVAAIADAAEP
jgi:hypothetical protein